MTEALTWVLRPIAAVLADAARITGVSAAVITGPSRREEVTAPRNAAIWVARNVLDASLPHIGRVLGGRDHSTIAHAVNRAEELRRNDQRFLILTDQLAAGARARAAKGDIE